jgi:A/G-specific adenine glycosylase
LFSLPVFESEADVLAAWPQDAEPQYITPWKHVLTHRDLHLHPVRLTGSALSAPVVEGQWVNADAWPALGLPAPIRTLLTG